MVYCHRESNTISASTSLESNLLAVGTSDRKVTVIGWISGNTMFQSVEYERVHCVQFSTEGRYLGAIFSSRPYLGPSDLACCYLEHVELANYSYRVS